MTKTTGQAITETLEALTATRGQYIKIAELAAKLNIEPETMRAAVIELVEAFDDFRAEPIPYGPSLTTDADRMYGPVIGDEQRHIVILY